MAYVVQATFTPWPRFRVIAERVMSGVRMDIVKRCITVKLIITRVKTPMLKLWLRIWFAGTRRVKRV